MASSGRGDHPFRATFLADSAGLGRPATHALAKGTQPRASASSLKDIYGDFFFGAAGGAVALTVAVAGVGSMSAALTMGLARSLAPAMVGTGSLSATLTVTTPPAGTPRLPTSFITYCDLVAGRDRVASALLDDVASQQIFALDKEELIVSECWPTLTTASGAFVTVGKFEARVKDYAGSPTYAASWAWTPLAWAGAGVTSFEVRLQDLDYGSSSTLVVSTFLTSQIWRAFSTLAPRFANDADSLELSIRVAGGAGNVYVGGLGIFAP